MTDLNRLNTFLLVERFKWKLKFIKDALIPGEWVLPTFTSHPTKLREEPDTVLRVDNKSEVQNQTYLGVSVHRLQLPPRFSPSNPLGEMAQSSGFHPTHKVKTCSDCKMFDVVNWVAHLNGEDGPGGMPSHESFTSRSTGDFLNRGTSSSLGQRPFQLT